MAALARLEEMPLLLPPCRAEPACLTSSPTVLNGTKRRLAIRTISLDGCSVLSLQQLDVGRRAAEVIEELTERYEVLALDQEELL